MPIIPKELFPRILKADFDVSKFLQYCDEHKEDEYPELGYLLENNMTDFTLREHWMWANLDYEYVQYNPDDAICQFDDYINYLNTKSRIENILENPRFQERFDIITSRFAGTYLQQEVKDFLLKQDIQNIHDDPMYIFELEKNLNIKFYSS